MAVLSACLPMQGSDMDMSDMDMRIWDLEWSDKLSVGLSDIDQKHQRFIELINELNRAIVDRMELDDIRVRLQRLYDFAAQEFLDEDEQLKQLEYPEAAIHSEEHRFIVDDFHNTLGDLGGSNLMYLWIEAALKLKAQLINHFLNEDMKFRDYCRSRP